jgi:hypothetical protein
MSELKYTATQMNNVLSNSQEYYTNWREAEKINKELRARIAKLEAVVDKLIWSVEGRVEFMYSKHQREFEDIVAEYKERDE